MSRDILQRNARRSAFELSGETPEDLVRDVGSRVAPPPEVNESEEAKIQMRRLLPGSKFGEEPVAKEVRWQPHENVPPRQPAGRSVYEYEENSHNRSITASVCAAICCLLEKDPEYRAKPNKMGESAPEHFNSARAEMIRELEPFNNIDKRLDAIYGQTAGATDVKEALWELTESNTLCTQYGISWRDVLQLVWNRVRIRTGTAGETLRQLLHEAVRECRDFDAIPCLSGRINRVVCVLDGFYDDVRLQLSEAEQLANIIIHVRKKYPNYLTDDAEAKLLYRDLRTRFDGLKINKTVQKVWIKHLWPDDDSEEPPAREPPKAARGARAGAAAPRGSRR